MQLYELRSNPPCGVQAVSGTKRYPVAQGGAVPTGVQLKPSVEFLGDGANKTSHS